MFSGGFFHAFFTLNIRDANKEIDFVGLKNSYCIILYSTQSINTSMRQNKAFELLTELFRIILQLE